MKRTLFFLTIVVLGLSSCENNQSNLPNIVYILADDMGYGDLQCLNEESKIPTPHMDKIAANGMIFTDAHSPSAVCTPTRYGILTGRYCFRTRLKSGVLVGHSPPLIEADRKTVPQLLQDAGYLTACIGKWHLGLNWPKIDTAKNLYEGGKWNPSSTKNINYNGQITGGPNDNGFDYSFIIPASLDMTPYCYISNQKLIGPITGMTEGRSSPRGVFWRAGDLQEGFSFEGVLPRLTEEAVAFIFDQKDDPTPFFLYLPLPAPHAPWVPSPGFIGNSKAGLYGDFVNQVDQSIGEIVQALSDSKQIGTTLLIVTSDNGAHWTPSDKNLFPHLANGSFSGMKSDVWEGGHHIPFILQWPEKVAAGTSSNHLVCLTDLFATCAALTNQVVLENSGEDSYSILPLILDQPTKTLIRQQIIHHSISGVFSIRKGDFKFIEGKGSGGWTHPGSPDDPPGQLYNIKSDPQEKENLYWKMPEMVKTLQEELNLNRENGQSKK